MSLITDTWRQLVRRRLWPIAVLLLGGLVAVPVLLAKSPAAPPPAAAAPASAADTGEPVGGGLEAQPVVDVADATSRGRRHVLGARKDPFAPGPQPKVKATPGPGAVSTVTPSSTTSPGSGSLGGGTGLTTPTSNVGGVPTTAPVTPITPITPTTPATPSKPRHKVAPGTLTVRFGDATASPLSKLTVKRLDALPDADSPVAIYLGHGHGKRTAVFLIDSSVKPEGDGTCEPSGLDCQKIELRVGETEFLTVAGDTTTTPGAASTSVQYELDLVRIAGAGKKKAHAAHAGGARTARAGRTVARVVRLLHP